MSVKTLVPEDVDDLNSTQCFIVFGGAISMLYIIFLQEAFLNRGVHIE